MWLQAQWMDSLRYFGDRLWFVYLQALLKPKKRAITVGGPMGLSCSWNRAAVVRRMWLPTDTLSLASLLVCPGLHYSFCFFVDTVLDCLVYCVVSAPAWPANHEVRAVTAGFI
ncbi:hypothetical protein NPIL_674571 [Nephila pilipes]|uniref:Uncharacterized protein n=1 Tax=Nephila pilipes TaxID=299642 RepID=A0A8X6QQT5_NEPPI|nr:hypothetical protein NPIL_674571 [Nephila pilipes]